MVLCAPGLSECPKMVGKIAYLCTFLGKGLELSAVSPRALWPSQKEVRNHWVSRKNRLLNNYNVTFKEFLYIELWGEGCKKF